MFYFVWSVRNILCKTFFFDHLIVVIFKKDMGSYDLTNALGMLPLHIILYSFLFGNIGSEILVNGACFNVLWIYYIF